MPLRGAACGSFPTAAYHDRAGEGVGGGGEFDAGSMGAIVVGGEGVSGLVVVMEGLAVTSGDGGGGVLVGAVVVGGVVAGGIVVMAGVDRGVVVVVADCGGGLVVGGMAARGAGWAIAASAAGVGGAGSGATGRPPLPFVPGGTGPGAEGVGTTPVR